MLDPITFTVTPFGQDRSLTINLTELLERLQTVPDQRKRRGVRYPLAVLLAIAVLAKLCGQSQVHALAGWSHERAVELSAVFGLKRARMPHPTTWTRVLGNAVAADRNGRRQVEISPDAAVRDLAVVVIRPHRVELAEAAV